MMGLKQFARDVNYFSLSPPMSLVKVCKNTSSIISALCYGRSFSQFESAIDCPRSWELALINPDARRRIWRRFGRRGKPEDVKRAN